MTTYGYKFQQPSFFYAVIKCFELNKRQVQSFVYQGIGNTLKSITLGK